MARDLYELADELDSLDSVCAEAAAEVAPSIQEQIRGIGRAGGPLRGGNAVACSVSATGTTVHILGVFTKGSKQRSWSRTAGRAVDRAVRKRLKE
jgi:hypothetical protein